MNLPEIAAEQQAVTHLSVLRAAQHITQRRLTALHELHELLQQALVYVAVHGDLLDAARQYVDVPDFNPQADVLRGLKAALLRIETLYPLGDHA